MCCDQSPVMHYAMPAVYPLWDMTELCWVAACGAEAAPDALTLQPALMRCPDCEALLVHMPPLATATP
jgi:hypothetical protein